MFPIGMFPIGMFPNATERLVVVAEMPLTPTRKIIKGRLKIPD